ncbi:MAG TPA: hypothetical protein VK937_03325 [Candidatus Limnocylindria bacterium]|jgi:hypothetical protein|nr:hypothetical protein [Candidatus Limnocylindria bacterium]
MSEAEQRLLDFAAALIVDLARTNTRVTEQQIALWLARVVVGGKR